MFHAWLITWAERETWQYETKPTILWSPTMPWSPWHLFNFKGSAPTQVFSVILSDSTSVEEFGMELWWVLLEFTGLHLQVTMIKVYFFPTATTNKKINYSVYTPQKFNQAKIIIINNNSLVWVCLACDTVVSTFTTQQHLQWLYMWQ